MLWWILAQHYLNMREFNEKILDIVVCPKTGGKLYLDKKKKILHTNDRKNIYKILDGVPILITADDDS
jgi:uncharacterized protein YbaR (Trm112 family)